MDEPKKIKIFLILEDQKLQDYIVLILLGEDFDVKTFSAQDQALACLPNEIPDLIISEYTSKNINALEICKHLRLDPFLCDIPLVCLIEDNDSLSKAKLIYAGADDYVCKSTLENEILIKVRLSLYRKAREKDINPLTSLPGQFNLWKELQKKIDNKKVFAACCADLFNLKDFNHRYGFKKGDEVIKYTASLILKNLMELGSSSDFICHPQSDDFFILTSHDSVVAIANKIIESFDTNISSFYDPQDRTKGFYQIKNRKGEIQKVPFLRIHFGIVTNEDYQFLNPAQVLQIATELKDFAQTNYEKSAYVKERRKNYPFY